MFVKILLVFSTFFIEGQFYEDKRCRCICPTPDSVLLTSNDTNSKRTLYIAYVPPNKCNCDGVILPKVADVIKNNAQIFCPRCDCKYETRNSTIIMIVVMIVLWIIVLLIGYNLFLIFLEVLTTQRHTINERRTTSDETAILLMQPEDMEEIL